MADLLWKKVWDLVEQLEEPMQLSLLTKFLTEVETCLKTGKIENATERKETKSLNNNVDETAKPNSNIEEIVKERKKVKVKKKVLVKKAKGEKTADPVKKDLLESTRMSVRQSLLEKRNQLEKDLMADKENLGENVTGKENGNNLPENKSIRRAFGGVKIVITEAPQSPQREELLIKESDGTSTKTSDKKEPDEKRSKDFDPKKNLRDIVHGFGKKKAIKDVTIKNRHQV